MATTSPHERHHAALRPFSPAVEVDVAGVTSVGRERHVNEDQFLIATLQRTLNVRSASEGIDARSWLPGSVEGTLLVVADGMGGHGGGDVASAIAVQAVAEYLCGVMPWFDANGPVQEPRESLPGVRAGLQEAVEQGHREVRRAAMHGVGTVSMGTTLTIAYAHFPQLYVAHVGDSRTYLHRAGNLRRLTRDHTLAERLREHGQDVGPSSRWHHVLWNAVGGGEQSSRPQADIKRARLHPNDTLLLCSDGLTKHVSDDRIAEVLEQDIWAGDAAALLASDANEAGGTDNITVVVARFLGH
jgi:protein phosphatase